MTEYSIFKLIKEFINQNKGNLWLYLFLSMAYPVNYVVLPYFYGKIIDKTAKTSPKEIFSANKQDIYTVLGLWIISELFHSQLDKLDTTTIPKLQTYIRTNLVMCFLETYKEDYKDPEIGSLMAQIIKLPIIIRELFHQIRSFILPTILTLIAAVIYMFYIDVRLGLMLLVGLIGFFVCIWYFIQNAIKNAHKADKQHVLLMEYISDLLTNMLNVHTSVEKENELKKLEVESEKYDVKYEETISTGNKFKRIFSGLYGTIFLAVNSTSFYLYSQKKLQLNQLTSILMIVLFLIDTLYGVTDEIRDFVHNIGILIRTQKSLNKLNKRKSITRSKSLFPSLLKGEIFFSNVNVIYNAEHALENLSLYIPPKQKIGVIGKIGSGKSTLVKCLLKLIPYTGKIYVDGLDIQTVNTDELRKRVIYIPQKCVLFNRSIYENIVYGCGYIPKEKIKKTLKEFDLDLPDLNKIAGKNGENLSGGQRQIVYLMRFLFRDGNIVVLDEPTSSLDEKTRNTVYSIIKHILKDKTVIIVTHDDELLKFVDKTITLNKGRIMI